jgi:hypothetical protein
MKTPSTCLFLVLVALSGGHSEAQAKLAITNGSFELPQIEEAIQQGTPGDRETYYWCHKMRIPGWTATPGSGYNRSMVISGKQNFYWNDPIAESLEQTLNEHISSQTNQVYSVSYWRSLTQSPHAAAAGKRMEFWAELVIGEDVVAYEYLTNATAPGIHSLQYTNDESKIGQPITIRFRATANKGWTTSAEIQSVFLDEVTVSDSESGQRFYAAGPQSPISPPPNGFIINVFFRDKPYRMAFDPPHFAGYVTDSGIGFANEWAETSYRNECYEVGFDPGATMWIEQAHPARVVVRSRGSLRSNKGEIARANLPSRSPYGPGDWSDEWFYIYPDGVSTRVVQIYTGAAKSAQAFWGREGEVFETQETFVVGYTHGHQPPDDIEINAVSLVNALGAAKTVNFSQYPADKNLFPGANIQIVNLRHGGCHPFTVVPAGNVEIRPYYGPPIDHEHVNVTKFVTWPRTSHFEGPYTSALTHIINWHWFEKTTNRLVQVYLCGLSQASSPQNRAAECLRLARSWQYAPSVQIKNGAYRYDGYSMKERAFEFSPIRTNEAFVSFVILASPSHPVVNPAFVLKDWPECSSLEMTINGRVASEAKDYQFGFESTREGPSHMVLWHEGVYASNVDISVRARSAIPAD